MSVSQTQDLILNPGMVVKKEKKKERQKKKPACGGKCLHAIAMVTNWR